MDTPYLPTMTALAAVLERSKGIDPKMVHLDEVTAAACLGQQPKTLESWRRAGKELPFIKLGRRVFYRLSDVLECLSRNTYRTSREAKTRYRRAPSRSAKQRTPNASGTRDVNGE